LPYSVRLRTIILHGETTVRSQEHLYTHVNGIENFRSFAKRRLAKFNGCASDKFVLHLKECEFRYDHRDEDLFEIVAKIFKG